jgi:hypothetical protein
MTAPAGALLVAALAAAGCDGCHRSKPYTPFHLGEGAPPLASGHAPPPADAGATAPAFSATVAAGAPADGRSWPLGPGRDVAAPAGRAWALGLVVDADGDGAPDLLAWARSPDGEHGGLWFAPGADKDAPAVELGAGPPAAPGCKLVPALSQIGPRSVLLDVARPCGPEPGRWLSIVRLAAAGRRTPPSIAFGLAVSPLAAPLDLSVDGADRDGDGRDDVTVSATLGGAPPPFPAAPPASATLRFFDRPSGMARDPSEPEASLAAAAARLVAEARRRSTAKDVAGAAASLRRLHAALCAEDGEPAVTASTAERLDCGPARSLEDAAFAEGAAALTLGEPERAAAALARLDAMTGPDAGKNARRRELDKLFAKAAPAIAAKEAYRTTAVPEAGPAGAPSWLPLAFEASGDLLVRTAGGVVRVRAAADFREEPVPEATAWPIGLTLPPRPGEAPAASARLVGVSQRCGSPWLVALLDAAGARAKVALPIEAPVAPSGLPAARCEPLVSVPVVPLDAAPLRFEVGGEIVELAPAAERGGPSVALAPLRAADARMLGSARSPDGRAAALPLPGGVLVVRDLGKDKPAAARWGGPDLEKAWSCTPSNGGKRVACITAAGAAIYEGR